MTPWKIVLFVIIALVAYELVVKKIVVKAVSSFEGETFEE